MRPSKRLLQRRPVLGKYKTDKDDESNNKRGCYCCSSYSRKSRDEQIQSQLLKKAPQGEWQIFWNPDDLPNSTGSDQLDSFFILRHIFLYLPLRLDTILAVASVNRAWRILSDACPHWRYLLPMKSELVTVMTSMAFGDPEYSNIYPKLERDYTPFEDERVAPGDEPHYNLKLSDRMIEYMKTKKKPNNLKCSKTFGQRQRRTSAPTSDPNHEEATKCHVCPDSCGNECCDSSDDCTYKCPGVCSSCSCSSGDDHKEEEMLHYDKFQKFQSDMRNKDNLLASRTAEEKELCQVAFQDHQSEIDWFGRLRVEQRKQRREERKLMKKNKKDADSDKKKNNEPVPKRKPRIRRRGVDFSVPYSNAVARYGDDDDDDDDDIGAYNADNDDDDDNLNDAEMISVPSSSDDDDNEIQIDGEEESDEENERAQHLSNAKVIPFTPQTAPTNLSSARKFITNYSQVSDGWNHLLLIDAGLTSLIRYSDQVMKHTALRKDYLFPTLSSFLNNVRFLLKKQHDTVQVTFWERYGEYTGVCIVFFLLLVVMYMMNGLIGLYVDRTVFVAATDQVVARNMAAITTIASIVLVTIFTLCFGDFLDEDHKRPVATQKSWAVILLVLTLSIIATPLSLLTARINAADSLLAGGEMSICDAFSSLPSPSSAVINERLKDYRLLSKNDGRAYGDQCELPAELLPDAFASKTFVHFPEGTKLLYQPPKLPSRVVPFAMTRDNENATKCNLTSNAEVERYDHGYNNTLQDVNRGAIGYYTVILPSSCTPTNGINNFTVMIVGDFDDCPFWSIKTKRAQTGLNRFLHPRFTDIFSVSLASAAETEARSISSTFGEYVKNITDAFSPSDENNCDSPNNLLATVSSGNVHDFYLRVAKGYQVHWTASYYKTRIPYDVEEEGGPWAARPTWKDTLDYKLNGITALMADSAIFINHKVSASPVIPENFGDSEDANAFKNSEKTGGNWLDSEMSPFWTAAHPAGIRRLKHDFTTGSIGYAVFMIAFVLVFMIVNIFVWGPNRIKMAVLMIFIASLVFSHIPLLIQSAICLAYAAPDDSLELTQPVACLQASKIDAKGPLIFAGVLVGLHAATLLVSLCCNYCDDACDSCCNWLCDDVCEPCCDWCGENVCCCCGDCCDTLGDCCDDCCDFCGEKICCCCDDCSSDDCCCCGECCERCLDKCCECSCCDD